MPDKKMLRNFVETKTQSLKIMVVGDVMLDKYYYGSVTRISPEAPVPINRITVQKDTLGGAANVAHNLALLGAITSIGGYVGDDYHGQTLFDKFTARGIDFRGLVHNGAPTTTKLRVIGGHQQMLRMDFEEAAPVTGQYAARLMSYIDQRIEEGLDAIILSDYNKGALTPELIRPTIAAAHNAGVPVIIDPKGIDWTKYSGADYLTPNLREIQRILPFEIQNNDENVVKAGHYAMEKFNLKNMIITRSEAGLSLITEDNAVHIPTIAREVFDVSGAGDTVIAVMALALAGGLTPEEGARLANIAAGVVVGKLGTYAVSRQELSQAIGEAE